SHGLPRGSRAPRGNRVPASLVPRPRTPRSPDRKKRGEECMRHAFLAGAVAVALSVLAGTVAFAQGGNTSAPLTGTAVDSSGAPVPGATVVVKNEATGATYQAVSGDKGTFAVPALQAGTYTVTVSLPGFKQSVTKGLKVLAATPTSLRAVLELGALEETVVV